MKVLYLCFVDVSDTIGPSVNEREFIPALYKILGKENVHFILPKPEKNFPVDIPVSNVTFVPSSKSRTPHLWLRQQYIVHRILKSKLKERTYDLIILRLDVFPFALSFLANKNKSKTPFALKTAGSGQFNIFREKNVIVRKLSKLNLILFKNLVNNAVAVDVVSDIQKESLENISGSKNIFFIDNGVNTDRFYPIDSHAVRKNLKLNKYTHVIGYVGGSPWERGGLQIIEAIPLLLAKYPGICGVIVGSGSRMNILYDKVRELNIEERIIFTGQVPFEDVVNYINTFDIGISQLYKEKQGSSEQKVRQYLACGKPVIVSPGAVNNFVEEEGFGFIVKNPYDIKEFADRVDTLLSIKKEELKTLSQKIRKYAEDNLSVVSRVKERLQIYEKVLEWKRD